jgi:hypothetical protein
MSFYSNKHYIELNVLTHKSVISQLPNDILPAGKLINTHIPLETSEKTKM